MDKIKTFEDACAALGISTALPEVSMLPEAEQKAIVAHYKLTVIAKALNDGWQPDWSIDGEWKYYPWFDVEADASKPSGFGLSYYDCGHTYSNTYFGSRLCFKSRELAKYAGVQFADLYEEYFLINK